MVTLIILIGILCIIDLSATVEWITKDVSIEANPLMRQLWIYSPGLFVFAKLMITVAFCYIAYRYRENKLMQRFIWLPLLVYSCVTVMHIMTLKV